MTNVGDAGPGSLRQAILDADAARAGASTIAFDIPGDGVQVIAPLSPLPAITRAVLIDGTSQPGFAGAPLIELEGSQAGTADGLTITGPDVTVRGLDIGGFGQGAGIHLAGAGATGDWIYGNFLGTDPTGTQAAPNNVGVEIDGAAVNNLVGINGDGVNDTAERNLLSGDLFAGVWITGAGTDDNAVAGNFLGTDLSGTIALNNATQPVTDSQGNVFGGGVAISAGASDNRIGTNGHSVDDVGERNVIAGSNNDAIDIYGSGTDGNILAGNFIGTDVTGTRALGVAGDGVFLAEGASFNRIGVVLTGETAGPDGGDLLSGNDYDGVQILGGADGNLIAGDRIGTDATGTSALPNGGQGVEIDGGCVGNLIGGTTIAAGNVISANAASGVWITGTGAAGNLVQGNRIGTDGTGTAALGNAFWGVVIQEGADNTVGGAAPGAGNLISGNHQGGVAIRGIDAVGDVVQGNLIGTDVTGTRALGNAYSGVYVGDWGNSGDAASDATIGGTTAGAGKVISANGNWGVWITGAGTTGVIVQGNSIGTDATGTVALGNADAGIQLDGGASGNTIGGATAAAGNLIAHNDGPGVAVGKSRGDTTISDRVAANRIFDNTGQAIDLGDDGVTANGGSPRQGPDNLQDFPIIVATADGEFQGWLEGCIPDSPYRVDLFASATAGADGSGEAQDFLGSLVVLTDGQGRAVFQVPFTPPPGLPLITATATDDEGNTSEVSALRQSIVAAPNATIRLAPGQSTVFSTASANEISVRDPGAGPIDAMWELTLSVSAGTLTLSGTAGLTGSGNGKGSLSEAGPLSALDVALNGLTLIPPPGFQGRFTLNLDAQSEGASAVQVQIPILVTSGRFEVTTTADSGPGSLRQAILDSNGAPDGTNTMDFAIPGPGVRTIALSSPLPPITASVLIDGTTQPGSAGAPPIAFAGPPPLSWDPLTVSAGDVTIRGLAIDDLTIDATADERLIALVHSQGPTTRLSLLDSQGHVLVQSDGSSPSVPDDVIDQHLAAGTYDLKVDNTSTGGQGTYTWTTMMMPAVPPFQTIPVGKWPESIVAGDFNGDGKLDLAIGNQYASSSNENNGTVSVLLGNGDGTFQPAVSYAVESNPSAIVAGDFAGDGKLDLAVADGFSQDVSVLMGNGDGTFQPAVTYGVGLYPTDMVAGDFNHDGRLDLAVACLGDEHQVPQGTDPGGVYLLLNNGDGTFQPAVQYAVRVNPVAIVAGDFTGDGKLDLAVACQGDAPGPDPGGVDVLLGDGDGTFRPAVSYALGSIPHDIVAGDFGGDGRLDLVVYAGTDLQMLPGDGDGTFQPARTVAAGFNIPESASSEMAVGDFNGDGKLDLAVANSNNDQVSILLGGGDGTFRPAVSYAVGPSPIAVVAGDFTGHGKLDLAIANNGDSTVSVLLGDGDGTFQTSVRNAVAGDPDGIVAGDFAGDGKLDLAVAATGSDAVSVLLGDGDGTFQPATQYAVGPEPYGIVAGDFNGDGRLDLAVAGSNSNMVSVLLGDGDGTFQPAEQYAVRLYPVFIVAGDFNGDGRLDLAVAGVTDWQTLAGAVEVLLGDGDGKFRPAVSYPVGSLPSGMVAGDFNGDRKLDLAVSYLGAYPGPSGVSVLLGDGDGTFQPAEQSVLGRETLGIAARDFNGDGRLGLAVAEYDSQSL